MASRAQPEYACALAEKLHQFFEQRKYTDFAICIDDARVECHKPVICAAIPYFDALCSTDAGTTEAALNGLRNYDYEERMQLVSAVRKFIYLGAVKLDDENVEKMLQAAGDTRHQQLTDKCERFLVDKVNVRKDKRYEELAVQFDLRTLSDRCNQLKKEQFKQVIRTSWFLEMQIDEAVDYLQDNELHHSEDDRLLAIHLWLKEHLLPHDRLEEKFHRLLELIRLQKCTHYQIENITVSENGCVLLKNELNRYLYLHPSTPPEIPGVTDPSAFVGPTHPIPTVSLHPNDIPLSWFFFPRAIAGGWRT